MLGIFSRLIKDESGATAIEYGLIAALVAIGIITSLGTLKTALNTSYEAAANGISTGN